MKLTATQIKNLKPKTGNFKVSDGNGLNLLITTKGAKYWRLSYRFNGLQKTLALGVYPKVSLQEARIAAFEYKKVISKGIDPSEQQKQKKLITNNQPFNTFESVAVEWFNKQSKIWVASHTKDVKRRLEINIYPCIGHLSIDSISPIQVLSALRKIENRQAYDLAHRVLGVCSQVFRYAVASAKCESDPTRDLKGALTPCSPKHQNVIAPNELASLMCDISKYDQLGMSQTKLALQMLAHTFVRTSELIKAKWSEFDFDKRIWRIPASRMKMKKEHWVPLTSKVLEILSVIKSFSTGEYVFGGKTPDKHISNNTMLFALYEMGYKGRMSGHGFRSIASTILNESGFRADIVERQLAHIDGNKVRAAYNRAEYLPERTKMMDWWSNHLASLENIPDKVLLAA